MEIVKVILQTPMNRKLLISACAAFVVVMFVAICFSAASEFINPLQEKEVKTFLMRLNNQGIIVQSHDRKIRTIFEVIHRPLEVKLLSPGKPFSNKKAIRDIISSCEKHIYWVDKYFSRAGLDWLDEWWDKSKDI